jgi:hypothetical protein
VVSRLAGDATWEGRSAAHLVIGNASYRGIALFLSTKEMRCACESVPCPLMRRSGVGEVAPVARDSGDGDEFCVTLPGHDVPLAEFPCCMCAQEAGQVSNGDKCCIRKQGSLWACCHPRTAVDTHVQEFRTIMSTDKST